ncbi:MAG: ParM/StbA family protein [Endomicrobium sp.]|jgi:hypothetical protein|nr:ParM/StbA family protein [Endomicrobium sp.]
MLRALDVGGSQTRIAKAQDNIRIFDSVSFEIDINLPAKTYDEDFLNDFIIKAAPRRDLINTRYVKGAVGDLYQGKLIVIDNQSPKTEQKPTYVNAIYAICRELIAEDLTNVDVKIGICIPVAEFFSAQVAYDATIRANLAGSYVINFPLLGRDVVFNIKAADIFVFPEGVIAAYAFLKDRQFTNGISLIIDAGYRSTDITILRNFKPLGKGARSLPIGGINLEAFVIGELERSGLNITREEAKEAFVEERIRNGSNYYDVKRYVSNAKIQFASELKNGIIDTLSYNGVALRAINNVLYVGRPFSGEGNDSIKTMLSLALGSSIREFEVSNLATANVEAVMGAMMGANSLQNT